MTVTLEKASRRYNYEWIFRDLSFTFHEGNSYAVLGPNGSGKSTLLQTIAGNLSLSEGTVSYQEQNSKIPSEEIFRHLSLCTPYLELPEEFTLKEVLKFQSNFKSLLNGLNEDAVIELVGMKREENKQIRFYSSGMKQRVKLALAVLANTPLLLLDEPTTNLDESGVRWYINLVEKHTAGRLVIVCSNQAREYEFCSEKLNMLQYK